MDTVTPFNYLDRPHTFEADSDTVFSYPLCVCGVPQEVHFVMESW